MTAATTTTAKTVEIADFLSKRSLFRASAQINLFRAGSGTPQWIYRATSIIA